MDEQKVPSAQINSQRALIKVLVGSAALSFFALFSIAYFYGSVQTAGDVLITPKNYCQVELKETDPLTGKTSVYYVDKIHLIDNKDPKEPKKIAVLEPAYIKIFETLKNDNLAILKKRSALNQPRFSLELELKPDRTTSSLPYEPLILQRVDFFADDEPYRISGRRDKKRDQEGYFFAHKGVCTELSLLLQLIN